MDEFKQQDIVWAKFPFSDMRDAKFRPALVVSNSIYNRNNSDVLVCAITSTPDRKEYSIVIDSSNLSSGKLPIKSMVRSDKIIVIEKNLLEKSFARLNDKTFDLVVNGVKRLIERK